ANLVDGETVTIDDGAGPKVFEFDTDGMVGMGNVQVDISTDVTATQVRDRLLAAINGVGGFNVTAVPDGTDQIRGINKDFGGAGKKAITKTVANAGFTVQGMAGGEAMADGRDFTAETRKYIRIYKGTGAGQVADVATRGKGWVKIGRVFNTTSRVAYDTSTP